MDKDINREQTGRPWMCILDAALVHVGAEFRNELRKVVPHIFLAFVSAGYTSVCQPLDVAVMRPFKAALQRACVEDSVLVGAGAGYKVNSSLGPSMGVPHQGTQGGRIACDVDVDDAEAEEFDLMQDDVYNDGGPEPAPKPKAKAKA
eukprot:3998057-Amphidinium_carterae.1